MIYVDFTKFIRDHVWFGWYWYGPDKWAGQNEQGSNGHWARFHAAKWMPVLNQEEFGEQLKIYLEKRKLNDLH